VGRKQNLNLEVKITIDAEYFSEGSLLRGDRRAGVEALIVHVSIESEAPQGVVTRIVQEAESGCFTLGAIRHAHPVTVHANLNGSRLELENTA
jgi:hypothetical protein